MNEVQDSHAFGDLVTVIVPVYNCEKYLSICIESVIAQTYKNIELVLIDDGATDSSGAICDTYTLRDNRIRVIHTKNHGPAAARNIGIKNSKGSFMFFLDADDFIEQNALSLLIENYRRSNADLIVGDFRQITKNDVTYSDHNRVFSTDKLLTKKDIIDYTKHYLTKPNRFPLFVYCWGRLFKSSIIKNNNLFFNPDLHTCEDVAFNFTYLKYANELFFLNTVVYNHLIHDYSQMSATMNFANNPDRLFGHKQALFSNITGFLDSSNSGVDSGKEIGHAYICYTIIVFVRICGQLNNINKKKIYAFISEIINSSQLRDSLLFYSPTEGDSRILPILMKLKLVWLIILVCRYKAHKRYKKGHR